MLAVLVAFQFLYKILFRTVGRENVVRIQCVADLFPLWNFHRVDDKDQEWCESQLTDAE